MSNDEVFFDGMSAETRELFRRALVEVADAQIRQLEEKIKDIELPPPSRRHKIRMNRLLRERCGSSRLPFPEVDNLYERVRSKIVVKLKINEFLDHCKERRRIRQDNN